MINYKGYDIPDTIDEILDMTRRHKQPTMSQLPSLIYHNEELNLHVNVPITIEEYASMEKKEDEIVKIYTDIVKQFINYKKGE